MCIGSASIQLRNKMKSSTKKAAWLMRLAGSILGAFCYEKGKFLNQNELCQQTSAAYNSQLSECGWV
jgi:hypothetical protein